MKTKQKFYKPIGIQDECFGGTSRQPEITVIVRMEKKGKRKMLYKNEVMSFPDANYLDKYINENKLLIFPERIFRLGDGIKCLLLAKAK